MTTYSLSIVISTYGRSNEIKSLINSIHNSFPEDFYEIIIVSSDDPNSEKSKWLKSQKNTKFINPDIRIEKRIKSLYYYENIGIKECTNEFVLVINDDMSFEKDFYEEFIKLKDNDIIFLKTHLGVRNLGLRLPVIGTYKTPEMNIYENLFLADFIVCRKSVYEDIGFLDENIDWYGIGVDLSLYFSFSKIKYKINYENNLCINHLITKNDRDNNSHNASIYGEYIENKWRKFCQENNGYDFNIPNW